ncbi:MAG: hypothetical protein ACJ713_10985 [Candidatus Sulfotelmatobacter sp.]
MVKLKVSLFLICLTVSLTAVAAEFWVKKPYQNWSADETRRMLEESPWATTYRLSGVQTNVFGHDAPSTPGYRGEMETNPAVSYNIQFRSAAPIRRAQVRSSQLNSHYDRMSAEQKVAFDTSAAKFLATSFPDRIIVSVSFHTNVQNYESLLRNYWAGQSMAKLSTTVYLNTSSEKLSLIDYSFKEDTFQFTFKRPKQLSPDEKLGVEFVHPRIGQVTQQRILQEFSVKKMLVDGEPAF